MQWWILGLAARFPFPVWLLGGTIWLLYTGQIPKSQLAACYSVASAYPWALEALPTCEDVPSGHEYFVT